MGLQWIKQDINILNNDWNPLMKINFAHWLEQINLKLNGTKVSFKFKLGGKCKFKLKNSLPIGNKFYHQ